jgi:hypothetical protein
MPSARRFNSNTGNIKQCDWVIICNEPARHIIGLRPHSIMLNSCRLFLGN